MTEKIGESNVYVERGIDKTSLSICWYLLKLSNKCMRAYYTSISTLRLFTIFQ